MPISQGAKYRIKAVKEIEELIRIYKVPYYLTVHIREALYSREWDFWTECDGCTFAKKSFPTDFPPPCLVHDYLRQNNIEKPLDQDLIFKDLLEVFYMPKWFFFGVRFAWMIFKK